MLYVDGIKYKLWVPPKEEDLENFVEKNATKIFGEDFLYLPLKTKLKSLSGIGSIPDGYAIGLTKPYKWYIIEIELSIHPVFSHIVPQLNKFIQGLRKPSSRKNIVEAVYNEIKKEPITEAYVREKIGSGEIYRFLNSTIEKEPTLTVIIDQKTRELEEACESIPIKEKLILEFRVYERVDAGIKNAFLIEPLFEERVEPSSVTVTQVPIGPITNQKEYEIPILKSLVELGGSGKMHKVLDMVFSKMESRFTEADLSKLETGSIRWRNYTQWARQALKEKGYIKSGSPRGIWEITEEGKAYCAKMSMSARS